jgi:hypothetical protein
MHSHVFVCMYWLTMSTMVHSWHPPCSQPQNPLPDFVEIVALDQTIKSGFLPSTIWNGESPLGFVFGQDPKCSSMSFCAPWDPPGRNHSWLHRYRQRQQMWCLLYWPWACRISYKMMRDCSSNRQKNKVSYCCCCCWWGCYRF